ncbi:hypothetical protein A2W32_01660 [candidate division WWE3 bacterium RBG_16_37_10]|uniref:Uncharacterized protein n=1 Tax=candidate division WWE3 bacterium RBG_16_37_10 TaxID=1802610 RepID=A0A1F4USX5_UNCKA|nr:MAG: hypothetical protein A2W32_01660 [candidate division WWE3 bacterium RBG_16_37_10]
MTIKIRKENIQKLVKVLIVIFLNTLAVGLFALSYNTKDYFYIALGILILIASLVTLTSSKTHRKVGKPFSLKNIIKRRQKEQIFYIYEEKINKSKVTIPLILSYLLVSLITYTIIIIKLLKPPGDIDIDQLTELLLMRSIISIV